MHRARNEVIEETIAAMCPQNPLQVVEIGGESLSEREVFRSSFILAAWSHATGLGSSDCRVTPANSLAKGPEAATLQL